MGQEYDFTQLQRNAKNFVCKSIDEMSLVELRAEFRKLEKITSDWINKCVKLEIEFERLKTKRFSEIL